jgi:hypothetical protein
MVQISISKETGLPLTSIELMDMAYEYHHGYADIMTPEEFMDKRLYYVDKKIGAV